MNALTASARLLTSVALTALLLLSAAGCGSTEKVAPPVAVKPRGAPPTIEAVVAAHNQRVDGLTSLWARHTLRVSGKLANSKLDKEEAEGHFQLVLPRKVAVTVTKVGETYFYLGSNDELYWWLDLTEAKQGFFGRHALATTSTVDRFGIPVHPLDLIELMAITPIDAALLKPPGKVSPTKWSSDGELVWYDAPARDATKRVLVDPKSLVPLFVELLDKNGKVVVRAELANYLDIASRSKPSARPRIPTRVTITVPRSDLTILINLYDPETRVPKPAAFDFAYLAQTAYPINKLVDLDKPADDSADKVARPSK
ncbi:MAG: hypothetical protein K2Y21_03560 [Phycisphaerales bacterium]|nr:hypothetical protein [Phycisphaerales bacterium]